MASTSNPHQQQQQQQQQQQSSTSSQQQTQQSDFSTHNSHIDHNSYVTSENQLAGLVQAATAAAGQDVTDWAAAAAAAAAAAGHHHLDGYSTDLHLAEDSFGDGGFGSLGPPPSASRPVRTSTTNGQGQGLSRTVSKKRKRGEEALDPALTGAGGGAANQGEGQQQQQTFDGSELNIRELPPQQSLTDARAAGVHSAAALFRQPSNNKKYTRPPMSRLFTSLELSPENFLHLQAAAKNYMLNDDHPERRDCVGQRGKGDTEMVKLRLWNCVRNFLEEEGNGERFFGEHVVNEGMPPRQYIWPRDQHKIISLVIPLLRRMVTNERQRQYAIETRKGGATDERKQKKTSDNVDGFNLSETPENGQQHEQQDRPLAPPQVHQGPDHFLPPPPLPSHDIPASGPGIGVGMSSLVLDGYSTDWDHVSRSYNAFNQDYQLDTLWGMSGLQQPDWWGLMAALDSHFQVYHHGDSTACQGPCEENYLNRIFTSDEFSRLDWRVGGGQNTTARTQFASSITRDMSRIIKECLGKPVDDSTPTNLDTTHTTHADTHTMNHAAYLGSMHHSPFDSAPGNHHDESSPITVHFNILQEGKRLVPRLDATAAQCPDLASMRNFLSHRLSGQLPASATIPLDANGQVDTSRWRIQVWLPEGVVAMANDSDWAIAQLSAGTIDWMDNDLRVIVDLDDAPEM